MSVDPINYQASSRYEKSETTTMKLLLLFVFVAVTVAFDESEKILEKTLSRIFAITPDQSRECIKKTGVTSDDITKMADSMERNEIEITDMKSVKTACCAMVCGAQKQGTMVGKEIQLVELNNYFQQMGMPNEIFDVVSNSASFCKDNVEEINEEDVCMVMYRFLKCMFRSLSMFGE